MWQVTNKDSPTGGEEEGGAGWRALKHGRAKMRTYQLGGRKREEQVGELRNMAGHKRGLTNWRGGRGRSGLVSSKTWEVINEDSLTGGEEEGGASWWASKHGTSQTRTHQLEGREEEEGGGERRNWACHK